MITTKYEEELSKRVAKVGDKFILRGSVYKAIEGGHCKFCAFGGVHNCEMVPFCSDSDEGVHYIKLEEEK